MKSPVCRPAKGRPDNFSARIDLRIDPIFKKKFLAFCKLYQIKPSDAVRLAIQQCVELGSFKRSLFEFLHKYPDSRKKFKEFLGTFSLGTLGKDALLSGSLSIWIEVLLGSEEEKLIKNTPFILLNSIRDTILTSSGARVFEERVSKGK